MNARQAGIVAATIKGSHQALTVPVFKASREVAQDAPVEERRADEAAEDGERVVDDADRRGRRSEPLDGHLLAVKQSKESEQTVTQ